MITNSLFFCDKNFVKRRHQLEANGLLLHPFPSRLVFSGCTLSWFIHLSGILTGHSHIWKGTVWSTDISVPLSKGFVFLFPFYQVSRLNCEKGAITNNRRPSECFQRLNTKRSNTCNYWYYFSLYGMVFWVEKKLINV